jgi:hypothetical protein
MRTKRRNTASAVAAVAMLALVLGSQPAARAEAEAPQGSAQSEGIKVHGRWTIDIFNPDGTRASHHEIENALQPPGALHLARFLGRVNSPGLWAVLLYSPTGTPNCLISGVACVISENRYFAPTGGDLTVSVPASGPNQDKLVLSGSFTSPDARSIFRVISGVAQCPTGTPGCQPGTLSGNFSLKDFDPIPVQAGQIVQVTVVFSFS